LVSATRPARKPATLGPIVCVAVVVLVVQQIVVAARGMEKEPLVTNFPMYAFTYPSTAAFDAKFGRFVNVEFYTYRPPTPTRPVFVPPGADLLNGQRMPIIELAARRSLIKLLPVAYGGQGRSVFEEVPGGTKEENVSPEARRLLKGSGPLLVT